MPQTAPELLEEIRQLPREEQLMIAEILLGERADGSQSNAESVEPGYEEWFLAGVEEARSDTSPDIQHEQVAAEAGELLRSISESKRLKASA